jgi:hypothetical protein
MTQGPEPRKDFLRGTEVQILLYFIYRAFFGLHLWVEYAKGGRGGNCIKFCIVLGIETR